MLVSVSCEREYAQMRRGRNNINIDIDPSDLASKENDSLHNINKKWFINLSNTVISLSVKPSTAREQQFLSFL